MNICYTKDENLTQELLTTNIEDFGSQSPLITALETENMKFTRQIACKKTVSTLWKGDLDSDTPHWKVLIYDLVYKKKFIYLSYSLIETYRVNDSS